MLNVIYTLIVVAALLVVYKLLVRSLSRASRRLELDPHTQNSFLLLLRVAMLLVGLAGSVFCIFSTS